MAGVGIGSPGLLDVHGGVVLAAANFPGWENVRLVERVAALLGGVHTVLQGDGKCAALAEAWVGVGAGKDKGRFVMLTLGTGIGGGIVVHGRCLQGDVEPGHFIVDTSASARSCGCGQRGCLERYCSAAAVARQAEAAVASGEHDTSLLAKRAGQISCEDVFACAQQADPLATRLLEECTHYLALACHVVARIVAPHTIALSGGMTLAGDQLFLPVNAKVGWLELLCCTDGLPTLTRPRPRPRCKR